MVNPKPVRKKPPRTAFWAVEWFSKGSDIT